MVVALDCRASFESFKHADYVNDFSFSFAKLQGGLYEVIEPIFRYIPCGQSKRYCS